MNQDLCYDGTIPEELMDGYAPGNVLRLVIHCTATGPSSDWSAERLLRFFANERGWSKPGYRHYIRKDGVVYDLIDGYNFDEILDWEEVTYGAAGYNDSSIHVAYEGGIDRNGKPLDSRTESQKVALKALAHLYKKIYPDILVIGHNHLNPGKACPSFYVNPQTLDLEEENVIFFDSDEDSL